MEENIGVLLHKLTKYQTLLSNTSSHQKRDIYNQKINSYSNKLNKIGVNQRNINQLGGLIGGVLSQEEIKAKQAALRQQKEQISLKRPELDIKGLGTEVTASIGKLKEQIEAHKMTIEKNKSTIEQLEKDIKQKEEAIELLSKEKDTLSKEKDEISGSYEELANDYEKAMQQFLEYQADVEKTTGAAQTSNQQNVQELMSSLEKIAAEPTLEKESKEIMGSLTGEKPSTTQTVSEPAAEKPATEKPAEEQAAAPATVELAQPQPEAPALEE